MTIDVKKGNGGFFMSGEIKTQLSLFCGCCHGTYQMPIDTDFEIWANPYIETLDECIDINEYPFHFNSNYFDLRDVCKKGI